VPQREPRILGESNVANSNSARKRIRQNVQHRARNHARKSVVKTETRKFLDLLQKGDVPGARDAFSRVQKQLDQVAAKGTLHPNTVARRKARLARRLNAAAATSAAAG
jgi:small subunit ribosomal protein S20